MRYSRAVQRVAQCRIATAVRFAVGACALLCAAERAAASDERARSLAAGCRSCHQPRQSAIPALDSLSRQALAGKLRAYRDGRAAGTIMRQLSKGYSDEEIDAIAEQFVQRARR
jgi:cytochrome c553